MNKFSLLIIAIIVLLFGAGCSMDEITNLWQQFIKSPSYLRMTQNPEALCSNDAYATAYNIYNTEVDLTDRDAGILSSNLITLDNESYLKFSAAIWWENCKRGPYMSNQSCWAYFLSNNPKHSGWYRYYPNNTTDDDDIDITLINEIFYIPPLIKQWDSPLGNLPSDIINPLDYEHKIKIPGDFSADNYSALDQIKDLECLEALIIPATFPYKTNPSPGEPFRSLPTPTNSPEIITTNYPVINLSSLSNLINLRVLSINNIRTSPQHKNDSYIRVVPLDEYGNPRKVGYSALVQLNKLQVLYMQDTDAERINFLDTLTNLQLLDLSWNNYIEQISPVLWLPNLKKLYLRFIPEIDLSTTASLELSDKGQLKVKQTPFVKLKEIFLEGTSVKRIDSFKMAPDLQIVDLSAGSCAVYSGGSIIDRALCRLTEINLTPFNIIAGLKKLEISGRYLYQDDCDDLNKKLPNTEITCRPDPRAKPEDNVPLP